MSPSRSIALLLLSLLATSSCQSLSALNHGILASPQATENPFDGGALGSCEVPTTATCSVDYPVPTSIARLAAIIEQSIIKEASELDGPCRDAYQEALCNIRFPRCTQQLQSGLYAEVELNRQNCSVMFDVCPVEISNILVTFCNNLPHVTLPAAECSPVSEHAENTSREFSFCDIENMRFSVTGWMFEYIKYLDGQFAGLLYMNSVCGRDLATFRCNFGGRCTGKGDRIEFINTHETCNERVDCYGDDDQRHATVEVSCHLWPQEHLGISTYTGPTLPLPVATPVNSTEGVSPGGDQTGMPLDQVNSAGSLRQYVSWITISVLTFYVCICC